MAEHTPGPWEAIEFDGSAEVIDARGYRVADVEGLAINRHWLDENPHKHWGSAGEEAAIDRPQEEILANACLIEAAPDLLAALEGLFSEEYDNAEFVLVDGPGGTMEEERASEVVDRFRAAARAAIAKARSWEGEPAA